MKKVDVSQYGFKLLEASDKHIFDKYYEKMNSNWASSISFSSMVVWNHSIEIYHKVIGEYLVCFAYDVTYDRMVVLPFFGEYIQESFNQVMDEVLLIVRKMNIQLVITDISEWMLEYYENYKNIIWNKVNERGLCDYIYSKEDFERSLDTQDSRYNYKYFLRKNDVHTYDMSDFIHSERFSMDEMIEYLQSVWCNYHTCEECQYGCLKESLKQLILNYDNIGTDGIVVLIDDKIVGYTVVSMEKNMAIYQFKKTKKNLRGLNEYLHKECYDRYLSDAIIINYTEDMDVEGLRIYKSKLAPFNLSPKYELQEVTK